MKLIIVFLVVIGMLVSRRYDVDIKYCKALRYIENSKQIRKYFKIRTDNNDWYKVSDQIIDPNIYLSFFNQELKELTAQGPNSIIINEQPVIKTDTVLRKLSSNHKADMIVFFSKANKYYLFAEILRDTDPHSDDYKDLIQINVSKVILFVLDQDENIRSTYIKEFNYN
jgi:hypothetical protein